MFVWAWSGLFSLLFTNEISAGWIFFALGAVAVFIIRKKLPPTARFVYPDMRRCRLHSFLHNMVFREHIY